MNIYFRGLQKYSGLCLSRGLGDVYKRQTPLLARWCLFKFVLFYPNLEQTHLFSFILLIHEGSHREVYEEFQPSYDIFCRWCQGLFRPQVPCTPAYTAHLLTLHQNRANKQYRTCLLYTSPSPRDRQKSRMPSSA